MSKRQVVSGKKGNKCTTLSMDHVTRPPVPDLIQTKLIHVGMKVYVTLLYSFTFEQVLICRRKSVTEGYKVKQTIFPSEETEHAAPITPPVGKAKSQLKRSRSVNEEDQEEEEQYSSVPKLVVAPSFNSFTSEDDWEDPDWLLPKEVACADVEMKETN